MLGILVQYKSSARTTTWKRPALVETVQTCHMSTRLDSPQLYFLLFLFKCQCNLVLQTRSKCITFALWIGTVCLDRTSFCVVWTSQMQVKWPDATRLVCCTCGLNWYLSNRWKVVFITGPMYWIALYCCTAYVQYNNIMQSSTYCLGIWHTIDNFRIHSSPRGRWRLYLKHWSLV